MEFFKMKTKMKFNLFFLSLISYLLVGCNQQITPKTEKAKITNNIGNFQGCITATPSGSASVELAFTIPPETSVFYIYRDGVPVKTIVNLTQTTAGDNENLRPGQTYVYSCWAKIGAQIFQGKKEIEVTLPAAQYPNFKGILGVEETSTSKATTTNSKEVRVSWEPEADNGPRAYKYKIYAFYGVKTTNEIDWNNLPTPKKEVFWPATFSTFRVGEDMPYTFVVRACTKQVGDIPEYCDPNKLIISPQRSDTVKRITDGGLPTTFSESSLEVSADQVNGEVILTIPWNDNLGGVLKREIIRKEYDSSNNVVDTRTETKTTGSGSTFMNNPVPVTSYTDGDDAGELKPFTKYTYQVFDYDFSNSSNKKASNIVTITTSDLTAPTYAGLTSIEFKTGHEENTVLLKFPRSPTETEDPVGGATHYLISMTSTNDFKLMPENPCDSPNAVTREIALRSSSIAYDVANSLDVYEYSGLVSRYHYAFCVKTRDAVGNVSKNIIYRAGVGNGLAINQHRVVMRDTTAPDFGGVESAEILNGQVKLGWAIPGNGLGSIAPDLRRYKIRFREGVSSEVANFKTLVTGVREQEVLQNASESNIGVTLNRSVQAPTCYQLATPSVIASCEMFKDREMLVVTVDACDDAGESYGTKTHDFSVGQNGSNNCTDTYVNLTSLRRGQNYLVINDITAPTPWYGISSVFPVATMDGAVDVSFNVPTVKIDRDDFGYFKLYRIIDAGISDLLTLNGKANKEALSDPIRCDDITNCKAKLNPADPNSDYANDNLTYRFTGLDARRSYVLYLSAIDNEMPTFNERFVDIDLGVNTKVITTTDITPPYWNGKKGENENQDPALDKKYDQGFVEVSFNCIDDNQYKYEDNTKLNYNVYLFRVNAASAFNPSADFENGLFDSKELAKFAKSGHVSTVPQTRASGVSYFSLLGGNPNGVELLQINSAAANKIEYAPTTSYVGNGSNIVANCSYDSINNTVTGKITYKYKVTPYDENKKLYFAVCSNDSSTNYRCGSYVIGQQIDDTIPPVLNSVAVEYSRDNLPSPAAEDLRTEIVKRWKLKLQAFDSSAVSVSIWRKFSDSKVRKIDFPNPLALNASDSAGLADNVAEQVSNFSQTNIPLDPSYFTTAGFDGTFNYKNNSGNTLHRVYANYLIRLTDAVGNITSRYYTVLAHYPTFVASGDTHSCALYNSGSVQCWGDNTYGQLGYPYLPVNSLNMDHDYGFVQLGAKAKQIVVGRHHNCALLENGDVKCWGRGNYGQLGNKRASDANLTGKNDFPYQKPSVVVTTQSNHYVERLFAWGTDSTCAQVHNQSGTGNEWKLFCWGAPTLNGVTLGSAYLIGNGISSSQTSPIEVSKGTDMGKVLHMGGGGSQTCMFGNSATVGSMTISCTGYNAGLMDTNNLSIYYGSVASNFSNLAATKNLITSVTRVGAVDGQILSVKFAATHACALFNNSGKKFRCWGLNRDGLLGNNMIWSTNAYNNNSGFATQVDNSTSYYNFNYSSTTFVLPLSLNRLVTSVDDGAATWASAQKFSSSEDVDDIFVSKKMNCIVSSVGQLKCWGNTKAVTGMGGNFETGYTVGATSQVFNNYNSYVPQPPAPNGSTLFYNYCANTTMYPANSIIVPPAYASDSSDDNVCLSPREPVKTFYNVQNTPDIVTINSTTQDKVTSISSGVYENCAILNHGDLKCWGAVNSKDSRTNSFKTPIDHSPIFDSNDNGFIDVTLGYEGTWYEFYLVSGKDSDNQTASIKIGTLPSQGNLQCFIGSDYQDVVVGDIVPSPYKCRFKFDQDLFTYFLDGQSFTYDIAQSSSSDIDFTAEEYGLVPSQNILKISKTIRFLKPNPSGTDQYKIYYKIKQIAAGERHTCLLYETTHAPIYTGVKCWGGNSYGQLGYGHNQNIGSDRTGGSPYNYYYTFTDYDILTSVTSGSGGSGNTGNWFRLNEFGDVPIFWDPAISNSIITKIKKVVAGNNHTCAMVEETGNTGYYKARCWGRNNKKQLFGLENTTDNIGDFERGDYPFNKGRELRVKDIFAAADNTCILKENNKIMCFGDLSMGALQESAGGYTAPGVSTISKVAVGSSHVCILLSTGSVKCMGYDSSGVLGDGNTTTDNQLTSFGDVPGLGNGSGVKDIVSGDSHMCALGSDNRVSCWGPVAYIGASKDYTSTSYLSSAVGWFSPSFDKTVSYIFAGKDRTCAVLSGGSMKCWGDNSNYDLGYASGVTVDTQYPELMSEIKPMKNSAGNIATGDGVMEVAFGGYHTCFTTSIGNMNCSGDNTNGQQAYYEPSPSTSAYSRFSPNLGDLFGNRVNHYPFFKPLEKPDFEIIAVAGLQRKIQLVKAWDLDWDDNNNLTYTLDVPTGSSVATVVNNSLSKCFHLTPDQGSNDIECDFSYAGGANDNDVAVLTYHAIDGKTPALEKTKNLKITFKNDEPLYYEAVVAGETHNCAYINTAQKDIYCWGYNAFGQLGYGHTQSTATTAGANAGAVAYGPVPVLSESEKVTYPNYKIEDMALGVNHTCVQVRLSGNRFNGDAAKIRCWGRNNVGQLGFNIATSGKSYDSIGDNELPFEAGWVDFSATKKESGSTADYSTFRPLRINAIGDKTCALGVVTKSGSLYRSIVCWGTNRRPWEFAWDNVNKLVKPSVPTYEVYISTNTNRKAVDFGVSREHLCIVEEQDSDNYITCLGYNDRGALGINKTNAQKAHVTAITTEYNSEWEQSQLLTASSEKVKLIFSTDDATARTSSTSTKHYYIANRGSLIVAAPAAVTSTNALTSYPYTCALLDEYATSFRPDGYVKCWGSKQYLGFQLSQDCDFGSSSSCTVQNGGFVALGENGVVETAQYLARTISVPCALRKDGQVQCWGNSSTSSAGMGTAFWSQVLGVRVLSFSVGWGSGSSANACYVLDNYELRCAGSKTVSQAFSPLKTYCLLSDYDCYNSSSGSLTSSNSKINLDLSRNRTNHAPAFAQVGNQDVQVFTMTNDLNGVSTYVDNATDLDLDDELKLVILQEQIDGCLEIENLTLNQYYKVSQFPKQIKMRVKNTAGCALAAGDTYYAEIEVWDNDETTVAKVNKTVTLKPFNKKIKQVALGDNHTCVLVEESNVLDNFVKCWGRNDWNQTGLTTATAIPKNLSEVDLIQASEPNYYVNSIHAGGDRSCAVIKDNTDPNFTALRCWGFADTEPTPPSGYAAQSSTHPFAFAQNAWNLASNWFYEVVTGVTVDSNVLKLLMSNGVGGGTKLTPSNIKTSGVVELTSSNNIKIRSVHVGTAHTCVFYDDLDTSTSDVKCYGYGGDGRFGKGTVVQSSEFADAINFIDNPASFSYTMTPGSWNGSYYVGANISTANCSFTNANKPGDPRSGLASDRPRHKYNVTFSIYGTGSVTYNVRCIPAAQDCATHTISNETASDGDGTMSKFCFYDSASSTWKNFNSTDRPAFNTTTNYYTSYLANDVGRVTDSNYADVSLYVRKPKEMSVTLSSGDVAYSSWNITNALGLYGTDSYTCLLMPDGSVNKTLCWGILTTGISSTTPTANVSWGDYTTFAAVNGTVCYKVYPQNTVVCKGSQENYIETDTAYRYLKPALLTPHCAVFKPADGVVSKETVKCWGRQNAYYSGSPSTYRGLNGGPSDCSGDGCYINFYNNLGIKLVDMEWNQRTGSWSNSFLQETHSTVINSELYYDMSDRLKSSTFSQDIDFKLAKYTPNVDLFKNEYETVTSLVTNPTGQFHCAIIDQYKLRCWGLNAYGQLGYGKNYSNDAADRAKTPAERGDVPLF